MENEIKVGEYGRTNQGKIIKFAWLKNEDGKTYKNKVILVDLMLTEANPYYYFEKNEFIVKHSKNINDLIEIGDIVYIQEPELLYCIWNEFMLNYFKKRGYILERILTKEQFLKCSYKVNQ